MAEVLNISEVKMCSRTYVIAINETLNVISGKWKLPIIGALFYGKKRFKELEQSIERISPRMLSKELKELEINGIIHRNVIDSIPVTIEYELTESGHNFHKVLNAMLEWGIEHRNNFMTTPKSE